jgi:hypothetical protein
MLDPVYAQVLPITLPPEPIPFVVVTGVPTEVPLDELTGTDLSYMSAAWWKERRKEHIRLLESPDEQLREQALQNLVFFAQKYRDKVDLTNATPGLYRIYQSDANEDHRVMALAALHATGIRSIMELLREDVKEEKSARVRRYTLYALCDYYKHCG